MKKLFIGCGLALVIFGVTASVAAYYFVYRPARAFVSSMTDLGNMPELETALINKASFTPPAGSSLTEPQVRRFMAVQQTVKTQMGSRFSQLDAKYKAIDEQSRGGQRSLRIGEMVGAYQDLFGLIGDARRAQVDALNAQNFSKDEYNWVRTRVYEAAGLEVAGLDLNDLVDKVKSGTFELPDRDRAKLEEAVRSVPEQNRKLVAPHLDALKDWVPYAIFGL